jgi:hypothetical protein
LTRPILPPKEFAVTEVPLAAGMNTLEFAVNAKNAGSAGYRMGLDCLVLERTR